MAGENEAIGQLLESKVKQLIERYRSTLNKNVELSHEILLLREQIAQLSERNDVLRKELDSLRIAKGLSSGEGSEVAKRRISQLVREIDKCIALLSN